MRNLANQTKGGKSTASRSGNKSSSAASKTNARKADVKYESYKGKKSARGGKKEPTYSAKHFMISVILGALALFIVVSYAFPNTDGVGVVGQFIRNAMFGVFGGGALLVPVLLFVEAIFLKKDVKEGKIASRPVSCAVTVLMVSALLHAAFAIAVSALDIRLGAFSFDCISTFFDYGMKLTGGGVLGGLVGMLIMSLIGPVGTIIVAALLIVFCAIFVFGISFSDIRMKYMKMQEKRAIRNEEKAEAAVRKAEEAAIISKREEMRRAEIEKEEAAERKRKEEEEKELERIRKSTQAHNERASQIRRGLDKSKQASYDETDETPRARKHGDVEEIFHAGLIEDTMEETDENDTIGDDGDKEFQGASVDEFWLENDPDSETTFVDIPEEMGQSAEFPAEGGATGELEGGSFETIETDEDDAFGTKAADEPVSDDFGLDTYEHYLTEDVQENGITGETPIPEDAIPWDEVTGGQTAEEADPVTAELRRTLDIGEKDALEIYVDGTSIVLKKFKPTCVFCDSAKDIQVFKGKNICPKCLKEIRGD